MSSAPSLTTSSEAARPAPSEVEIGFAGDDDEQAAELHRFLCVIATLEPDVLKVPIDPIDSMDMVRDVLRTGFAVTARAGPHLVGSLGVISTPYCYNRKYRFMTDRWFFTYREFRSAGVGGRMQAEAHAIANDAGQVLMINGHQKRRGNGICFTRPVVLGAPAQRET